MRLRRFLLRYFPPGITVEYEHSSGEVSTKTIDLLTLGPNSDLDAVCDQVLEHEPIGLDVAVDGGVECERENQANIITTGFRLCGW